MDPVTEAEREMRAIVGAEELDDGRSLLLLPESAPAAGWDRVAYIPPPALLPPIPSRVWESERRGGFDERDQLDPASLLEIVSCLEVDAGCL